MGSDIDGRADQYALAATAFHLFTGAPPYQHSNPVAVISQHLNAAPPKLTDRRPDLAHLDQVLSTALAKDPADRFDQCSQFATALSERAAAPREFLGAVRPAPGQDDARPPSRSAPERRHSATAESTPAQSGWRALGRRRRKMLLTGATAVVVLTVIGWMIGYMIDHQIFAPPTSTPATIAAGPVLLGTYRMDYDWAKRTKERHPRLLYRHLQRLVGVSFMVQTYGVHCHRNQARRPQPSSGAHASRYRRVAFRRRSLAGRACSGKSSNSGASEQTEKS